MFAARPAPNYRRMGENISRNAAINRAPRRPNDTRVRALGVLRALTKAGCSRFPRLGVLGFLCRMFSVSQTGCSRFPVPGVLGLLLPCRVFSAILTGCFRFPAPGVRDFPSATVGFRCQANVLLRGIYLRVYSGAY